MNESAWLRKKSNLLVLWMLLPALLLELLIHLLPMIVGLYISFTHLTTYTLHDWLHVPFTGLENYKVGLNPSNPLGAAFFWSFFISLAYTAITVTASTFLGLGAALLVNHPFPGKAVFRTIFLLPYAMPVFVVGIVWRFMFMRDWGLVNQLLVNVFHLTASKPFWLIGPHAFIAIVIASIWKNWPFLFLISLAGLQTIPPDQYEAAEVDGANTFRKFLHITLPSLRPVISIGISLSFLWTFNDFTLPFSMLGAHPSPSADVLTLHIYANSFQDWNFGTGAAMSVLMMVALGLIVLLFRRLFRLERRNDL